MSITGHKTLREIERYTKQRIPAQVIEGFGPEPGERGEPIAMGRQTIWGGAGKPPSREVMAAAAKAARTEMLTRVREKKASDGPQGRGYRRLRSVVLPDRTRRTSDIRRGYAGRIVGCSFP